MITILHELRSISSICESYSRVSAWVGRKAKVDANMFRDSRSSGGLAGLAAGVAVSDDDSTRRTPENAITYQPVSGSHWQIMLDFAKATLIPIGQSTTAEDLNGSILGTRQIHARPQIRRSQARSVEQPGAICHVVSQTGGNRPVEGVQPRRCRRARVNTSQSSSVATGNQEWVGRPATVETRCTARLACASTTGPRKLNEDFRQP